MNKADNFAPGRPGSPPRWTSSAKSGVGTALNSQSRVWFTLSHGIFNEVYYPRVDQACIRDMGLISKALARALKGTSVSATMVGVSALATPGLQVEIEATAILAA